MPELEVLKRLPPMQWGGVQRNLRDKYEGKVSAVCRSKDECADLVHWFGDEDFCPFLPVFLAIPGAPQIIAGLGLSTASELRDQAVAVWEIITNRLDKKGTTADFDELREKHGLMRREDVDAAVREAMRDRIKKHRANPITDPPRIPHYVYVNARTTHTVADPSTWRET